MTTTELSLEDLEEFGIDLYRDEQVSESYRSKLTEYDFSEHPELEHLEQKTHVRSGMPLLRAAQSLTLQDRILRNAGYPEHLINYDFIDLDHRGRCLCTLKIVSGAKCIRKYAKGYSYHIGDFQNHWCWAIDNSPEQRLCPDHSNVPATAEELLLKNASIEKLVKTPGARPINAIFEEDCPVCLNMCAKDKNGSYRLEYNQALKSDLVKMVISPYTYAPEVDSAGLQLRDLPPWLKEKHFLTPGMRFHSNWSRNIYPGMNLSDIWIDYFDPSELDPAAFDFDNEDNAPNNPVEFSASARVTADSVTQARRDQPTSKRTRDSTDEKAEEASQHKKHKVHESSRAPRIGMNHDNPKVPEDNLAIIGRSGLDFYHWTRKYRDDYQSCIAQFWKNDEPKDEVMNKYFQDLVLMCRREAERLPDDLAKWP